EAWRRASDLQRAMSEGTTTSGGFLVPTELDPSVNLSSDGSINPLRQIAKTRTVTSNTLKLVSSDGVSASFDLEAAEVSDDTPTLAQPTISVAMARAFVPYSIEVGMDSSADLAQELGGLLTDAKDQLEATKFLSGTAIPEPQG